MYAALELLGRLQKDLEPEDLLLTLVVVLLTFTVADGRAVAWLQGLPEGARWLLLLLGVWSGYLVCLGTRVDRGDLAAQGPTGLGHRAVLALSYLAQLGGVPLFAMVLAARDEGEGPRWVVFAGLSALAILGSLRPRAPRLRVRTRRWLLLPLTLYNSWYLYEIMARFLSTDRSQLLAGARALNAGDLLGYGGVVLDRVLAFTLFLLVPYGVLVLAPRVLAGERPRVRAWLKRYAFFVIGLSIGFLVDTLVTKP